MRGIEPVRRANARWRVPNARAELAELVCRFHIRLHQVGGIRNGAAIVRLLKETDALRRPERFQAALNVCRCDAQGRLGLENAPYPQQAHWLNLLAAAQSVDAGAVAWRLRHCPEQIPVQIDRARAEAVSPVQQAYCSVKEA